MFTMVTLQSVFLGAIGMGCVYLGIAFLNSLLLPSLLGGVYAATEHVLLRLLVAFPFFFGPANLLVGKAYEVGGPTIGGVSTVVFTVIWMTLMAVIVDQVKVNMWIVGGAMVAVLGCLLVVYGIKSQAV